MKKALSIICASALFASCLSSPIYASAFNSDSDNNSSTTIIDEKTIAALIDWGVDPDLLDSALSASPNRSVNSGEYVIAYYSSQAANYYSAGLRVGTYYSSNLDRYTFQDPNHIDPSTGNPYTVNYVSHEMFEITNQSNPTYGNGHTANFSMDMLYLGASNNWITAGLFYRTGTGNITLGAVPDAPAGSYSPVTGFFLFNDANNNGIWDNGEYREWHTSSISYETALIGDINNDGDVDVSDAVLVYNIASSGSNFTRQQKLAADVNLDQNYDEYDANLILKFIAHINTNFFPYACLYDDVDSIGGPVSQ